MHLCLDSCRRVEFKTFDFTIAEALGIFYRKKNQKDKRNLLILFQPHEKTSIFESYPESSNNKNKKLQTIRFSADSFID